MLFWGKCKDPEIRVKTSLGWLELVDTRYTKDGVEGTPGYRWSHGAIDPTYANCGPTGGPTGYATPAEALDALLNLDGFPHIDIGHDLRKACKVADKLMYARVRIRGDREGKQYLKSIV